MATIIGTPVKSIIVLIDQDYAPILGATFTEVTNLDPNDDPIVYTRTELGGGSYEITFTPLVAGDYNLLLKSDTDPPQWWLTEEEVLGTVTGTVVVESTAGRTLLNLVEDIADMLGDLMQIEATSDGDVGGGTWHDVLNISAVSPKSLKGSELVVTLAGGANLYQRVRVLDSVTTDPPTLTLTPALPEQVKQNDTADIFNLYSMGFQWQQYVRVINSVINKAFPNYLSRISYTYADAFDRANPFLVVPDDFRIISRVEWQDTQGLWQGVPLANGNQPGWNGWAFDFFSQRLVIGGAMKEWANTYPLRIGGYGKAAGLVNPTDITEVDAEWLASTAASLLLRSKRDPAQLAISSMDANDANTMRLKMLTQIEADSIQIR